MRLLHSLEHGLINIGTVEFMPIHFLHKSVNFDELIALYAVSDACIVSSTRDGMNLVAYEYIATQHKRHGVLVLSEFAGAAQSLNGSIIVNPWNTEELAGAYQEAVTMSEEQKALNFSKLEKYVSKYTSAFWGQSFVSELKRISAQSKQKVSVRKASLLVPGVSTPVMNGDSEQTAPDEVVVVSSEGEAEEEGKS